MEKNIEKMCPEDQISWLNKRIQPLLIFLSVAGVYCLPILSTCDRKAVSKYCFLLFSVLLSWGTVLHLGASSITSCNSWIFIKFFCFLGSSPSPGVVLCPHDRRWIQVQIQCRQFSQHWKGKQARFRPSLHSIRLKTPFNVSPFSF